MACMYITRIFFWGGGAKSTKEHHEEMYGETSFESTCQSGKKKIIFTTDIFHNTSHLLLIKCKK